MKKKFLIFTLLALTVVLAGCTNSNTNNMINEQEQGSSLRDEYKHVILVTNKGEIKLELFTDKTPVTSENFLKLADNNYYDNTKFHRVIKNFMIQGGDPLTKDDNLVNSWGTGGPGYVIPNENVESLSNVRGTISMANAGPNTGGSQFFINVVDNTSLDFDKYPASSQHTVFGRVVEGMEVVDEISQVKTGIADRPVEPVVIEDVILQP
ncbi:MAG: peptidylprolyl isomerase [Candidatus Pacebacteria bacterium]|nr:peptidylprolyl isomerase [Candidatus Paceibacterota bacterium]